MGSCRWWTGIWKLAPHRRQAREPMPFLWSILHSTTSSTVQKGHLKRLAKVCLFLVWTWRLIILYNMICEQSQTDIQTKSWR